MGTRKRQQILNMILKLSPKYQFSSHRHLHAKSTPLKILSGILAKTGFRHFMSDLPFSREGQHQPKREGHITGKAAEEWAASPDRLE
jgi:hypothetical protein